MPKPRQVANNFKDLLQIGGFKAGNPRVPYGESSEPTEGGHNYFYTGFVYTYTPTAEMKVTAEVAEQLARDFDRVGGKSRLVNHRGHWYSCSMKHTKMSHTENSVTITANAACYRNREGGDLGSVGSSSQSDEVAMMFALIKFMKAFDD